MPKFIAGLIVSLALAAPAFALETFVDEAKAQQPCPKDIVVWLNLPTMIWHYKGQRWYANTIHGAYACEKEAGAAVRGDEEVGVIGRALFERHLRQDIATDRWASSTENRKEVKVTPLTGRCRARAGARTARPDGEVQLVE